MTAPSALTDRILPDISQPAMERLPMAIYKAGLCILAAQNPEDLYQRVFENLKKILQADHASLYQVINGELQKVYTSLPTLQSIKPRKNGFTYKAFHDAVPYVLDNTRVFTIHPEVKNLHILSTLFIPLVFENNTMGVISVDFTTTHKFSTEELEILQLFGSIVTFKLQNLTLHTELQQLVESQKLFISLASHEIKNPLTSLKAYSQVMQKKLQAGESIKPLMVERLISETDRVVSLTNEFLSNKTKPFDEISLHYHKHYHSFTTIITHAITNFKLVHPKRKISFTNTCTKHDLVYGDYHKLLQLVINILNNAAKFSTKSTRVTLTLKLEADTLILTITDAGKGIAADDLPHIFDRYFKGRIVKKEGMGLGLYLCKKIVEEHAGKITVDSKVNRGTSFKIYLPHVV